MIVALSATAINAQTVKVYKGYEADGVTPKLVYELADADSVVFVQNEKKAETKGTATTKSGAVQAWTQLWENGPKFADFNVGATVSSYVDAAEYATAVVGGIYCWGGRFDGHDDFIEDARTSGSGPLTGNDDTAIRLWGDNWRMPTSTELQNMIDNCDWTWCDGVNTRYANGCTIAGYKVTGKGEFAQNAIFIPAAGYMDYEGSYSEKKYGFLWSSDARNATGAYWLTTSATVKRIDGGSRDYGYSVRAVCVAE